MAVLVPTGDRTTTERATWATLIARQVDHELVVLLAVRDESTWRLQRLVHAAGCGPALRALGCEGSAIPAADIVVCLSESATQDLGRFREMDCPAVVCTPAVAAQAERLGPFTIFTCEGRAAHRVAAAIVQAADAVRARRGDRAQTSEPAVAQSS